MARNGARGADCLGLQSRGETARPPLCPVLRVVTKCCGRTHAEFLSEYEGGFHFSQPKFLS